MVLSKESREETYCIKVTITVLCIKEKYLVNYNSIILKKKLCRKGKESIGDNVVDRILGQ